LKLTILSPFVIPGIIATGLAQAAIISSSKFATGTDSSPEGFAHVGERGKELMIDKKGNVGMSPAKDTLTYLQQGTKIIPADMTKQLLSNTYIANVAASKGNKSEVLEAFEMMDKSNKELKRVIKNNKPLTVNFGAAGFTVSEQRSRTLVHRIDKYFKS